MATTAEKYSRIVSVSGRTYSATPTMCDIFLAHVSDISARSELQLVPLLHQGGVEMILIGSSTTISVVDVAALPSIQAPVDVVAAA